MSYRNNVIESVNEEFEQFKKEQLELPVEEIFENSEKNHFYICFRDYFENVENEEETYKALNEKRGHIICSLRSYYLDSEFHNIATYGDMGELLTDYVSENCDENEME